MIRATNPEAGRNIGLTGYGSRILELWDTSAEELPAKAMGHHINMLRIIEKYQKRMVQRNLKSTKNLLNVARHLAEGFFSTLQSSLLKAATRASREEMADKINSFANELVLQLAPKMLNGISNQSVAPGESRQMRFGQHRGISRDLSPCFAL